MSGKAARRVATTCLKLSRAIDFPLNRTGRSEDVVDRVPIMPVPDLLEKAPSDRLVSLRSHERSPPLMSSATSLGLGPPSVSFCDSNGRILRVLTFICLRVPPSGKGVSIPRPAQPLIRHPAWES